MSRKSWSSNVNSFGFNGSIRTQSNDCDPRYLKPTILAFLGTPRLAQNGQFGVFYYLSYKNGFWVPYFL